MTVAAWLSRFKLDRMTWRRVAILALALILVGCIGYLLPGGQDLYGVFLPATRLWLSGRSPYSETMFFGPVWALVPFVPLVFLPQLWGRAFLFMAALCAFTFSAWRFGAKPIAIVAFLLSPPVVMALWLSSIDWMPILGFVLPPQIGLFLIMVKPQMGSMVALFWFVEALRTGGWKEALRIFWPVTVALVVTFGLYGLWPLQASSLVSIEHNASLWPISIPVGFRLLVAAFRKRQLGYALAASPCLSPYVMVTSWASVLMAVSLSAPETLAAVVGAWILVLLRASG